MTDMELTKDILDIESENSSKLTQRKINALETKERIKQAALKLFSKYGYDEVSVDKITATAGVSKGSFYNHFESKEAVLVEEFINIDLCYVKAIEKLPANSTAEDKIKCIIHVMTTYISTIQNVDFMKVVYSSQISSKKTVQIINNRNRILYQYMTKFVHEGIANNEFHLSYSEEDVIEWFMRSARGLIYDWCLYEGKWDIVKEGDKYFQAILDTIKK